MTQAPRATVDVVIPTFNRTDNLHECLTHLGRQTVAPESIVVVDASPDDSTALLISGRFPDVQYLRNPRGRGATATSRRIGFEHCSADVVAFLDDDAYPEPQWLAELVKPYEATDVGAVGGRALDGVPGEDLDGVTEIGRFLADGRLTGHFAAKPEAPVQVDHLLGANMSLRRAALEAVGGIRDYYPGTCLREETDLALRIRAAGWRLVFTPTAVVAHVAGPYARGRRFDTRYVYYAYRNHLVLLAANGERVRLRRYVVVAVREISAEAACAARRAVGQVPGSPVGAARSAVRGVLRTSAASAGVLAGLAAGACWAATERSRPTVPLRGRIAETLPPALQDRLRIVLDAVSPARRQSAGAAQDQLELDQALALRVSPAGVVLAGPFEGLCFPPGATWGGMAARLAGTYEMELHEVIEQTVSSRPSLVVDVGAAEGYYCLGLARRLPAARVLSYDIDPAARRMCARGVALNQLSNVEVRGRITPALLQSCLVQGAFVLSDCEGYERELLDPLRVPRLESATVLVELHEFCAPGVTREVLGRFARTHTVLVFDARPRVPADGAHLSHLSGAEAMAAMSEGRPVDPHPMQWALLEPVGRGVVAG